MDTWFCRRCTCGLAALALAVLALGCDEGKGKERAAADAGVEDAGPSQPVLGGRLGAAVAAASASASPAGQPPVAGDAPPENGVFTPEGARAALAPDAPFKLVLLSEGAEPRSVLALGVGPKTEQKVMVTLGVRNGGQRGMPSVDLELLLRVEQPKDKPKKEAAAEAAPAEAAVEPLAILGKVVSATVASMSLAGPPKEFLEALAKMKGSLLRYRLAPQGHATDFHVELAKGADPGLDSVLGAVGEVVGALSPVLPDKPVGAGAYWMVTDRVASSGVRMIRYRVFKVDRMPARGDGAAAGGDAKPDAVAFSFDTRQYAEDANMSLPNGAQQLSLTIDHLDSSGKGTLTWLPDALVPPGGDVSQGLQARLIPPGAQQTNQRMTAQIEITAKLAPPAPAPATP